MREVIYQALWEQFAGLDEFKTKSRRLKHWSAVDKRLQPALFMAQVGETTQARSGMLTQWQLNVDLYIYVFVNETQAASQQLNPLLDLVCQAIQPNPTGINNLGLEAVTHCAIDGKIETDEGTLGNQAIAIVPVTILACF